MVTVMPLVVTESPLCQVIRADWVKGRQFHILLLLHLAADSRKHFDDSGDHEDEPPPPTNGSQAFQRIC